MVAIRASSSLCIRIKSALTFYKIPYIKNMYKIYIISIY